MPTSFRVSASRSKQDNVGHFFFASSPCPCVFVAQAVLIPVEGESGICRFLDKTICGQRLLVYLGYKMVKRKACVESCDCGRHEMIMNDRAWGRNLAGCMGVKWEDEGIVYSDCVRVYRKFDSLNFASLSLLLPPRLFPFLFRIKTIGTWSAFSALTMCWPRVHRQAGADFLRLFLQRFWALLLWVSPRRLRYTRLQMASACPE